MIFQIGACVENIIQKQYSNGDIVKIGTKGEVLKVYELSESYSILFQGAMTKHRVLERDLKAC